MARSKSSKRWLAEHFDDVYVKQAQQRGLRSRSAFKLLELHEKYRLIREGMCVVDLGAAPGGWCQIAREAVGRPGRVIALDLLPMEPLPGVEFIEGDFTEDEALQALEDVLSGQAVDLVLSDMAPNMSGMATTDQAKAMYLAELALEFVRIHLKPGGDFLVKLFQGEGFDEYVREVRPLFDKVQVRKPKASRPRSREVYLLARGRQVK
jgi:23S rRNA (uridine2552-2'-O)-methyltransferase